jgi:cytidylate kinase
MDNILFKYFENRHKEAQSQKKANKKFGPVITISRQSGCEAIKVAKTLTLTLNKMYPGKQWKWMDKEILEKSAKELNLQTFNIENFLDGPETSSVIDLFLSFSKSHVNDLKIKNKIRDVILDLCEHGNIILVGRAGAAILKDKPNVLNVRLVAPFYWRIETIMNNQKVDIEEAEEWAIETDEKRHKLIYTFLEKQPGNIDYLFDATLNRSSFDVDATAEQILSLAKTKGIDFNS